MNLVLSLPAGNSYELITRHLVHSCPECRKGYQYKRDFRYIAFRLKGGIMERLYAVDKIYRFDPLADLECNSVPPEFRERLRNYIRERNEKYPFGHPGEVYRFYLLSSLDIIELPQRPFRKNLQGSTYFTLEELTHGRREV